MRKEFIGAALTAVLLATTPVFAAAFTVSPGTEFVIRESNDFARDLGNLGLYRYRTSGTVITLNSDRRLRFDYMGSESGNVNSFQFGSLPAFAEYNKSTWGPELIGSGNFLAGVLTGVGFNGGSVSPGSDGFGVFTPRGIQSYSSNVLYIGLDDFINNADDNHDDFIVRVSAVPEPATWAMLMVGFGLIGYSVRRRGVRAITA
ncbi:hypothetical protein GCM10011529_08950 [Polymorphobacter glacialis]|uniref:Ice-binding protein C-terminal domain-containing protein n=1 Tax=Sandarakinorhabdus glacialis TaxID=1614636 RepID=A0A916ZMP6_9SPHN|nr:PEPxxWA-CTERM sorting domain-containing protein [Polymorphobacter glacialis]GGE04819.1 hypothetical protein GCM10011529_08950 [Polymorphobacter glacialis]